MRYAAAMLRAPAAPLLVTSVLVMGLVGCGDDGKTAPRGAPAAPYGPAPAPDVETPPPAPAPAPTPPPAPTSDSVSTWAATRPGDWATWDLRVIGSDHVTKLTWRARSIDAAGVHYTVEARTLDVAGATKSLVASEEVHALGERAAGPGTPESISAAGRTLSTQRRTSTGGATPTTTWRSSEVPFSGLVKSVGADVEQLLVAFGRGPN